MMTREWMKTYQITVFVIIGSVISSSSSPPYVKQCQSNDPKLSGCIISALYHLKPYLRQGIPEIQLASSEPLNIDELTLALTSGRSDYKITLRDLDIYGASNFTVSSLKLGNEREPFEGVIRVPELRINAKYTSSGVLIILPAGGSGTFHARLVNIIATVKGKLSKITKEDGKEYLHIDRLYIEPNIKSVHMEVRKAFNNNRILIEATNLFLREYGQEVLKAMMPQLKVKLADVFMKISNTLLNHSSIDQFFVQEQ